MYTICLLRQTGLVDLEQRFHIIKVPLYGQTYIFYLKVNIFRKAVY